ncbi:MAG: hypothetical protein NZ482_01930 [Gloeomargarita sp. SKYG98]|nr:hypothetical protein [Gloeomargarita sp. SKYG98]
MEAADAAVQRQAEVTARDLEKLLQRLGELLRILSQERGGIQGALKAKDERVRFGGDPAKDPRRTSAEVKKRALLRIALPGWGSAYYDGEVLRVPRVSVEVQDEIGRLLQQGIEGRRGLAYKPVGSLEYESVAAAGEKEGESLESLQRRYEELLKVYREGTGRHQAALDRLSEQVSSIHKFLRERFGQPVERLVERQRQHALSGISSFLARVQGQRERMGQALLERQVGENLWVLANKLWDQERPGSLHGRAYRIETRGPGHVVIYGAGESEPLFSFKQERAFGGGEIQSQLSAEELSVLLSQLRLINKTIGEKTLKQWIEQERDQAPEKLERVLGGFYPVPVALPLAALRVQEQEKGQAVEIER